MGGPKGYPLRNETRDAEGGKERRESDPGATGEENGQNGRLRTTSRDGTRLIAGHFDHAVSHQLRIIAAEEEVTIQALLAEALDLLFRKRGKPEINDLRNNNGKQNR